MPTYSKISATKKDCFLGQKNHLGDKCQVKTERGCPYPVVVLSIIC